MSANQSWWVPISLTHSLDPQFEHIARLPVTWLSPKKPSTEIADPAVDRNSSWIIVNLESSGYYRVNYDNLNWQLLADQLKRDHLLIPDITRAQLIDDAFILGHAGVLKYDVVTRLIGYLEDVTEIHSIHKMIVGHINHVQTKMFQHFNDGNFDHFLRVSCHHRFHQNDFSNDAELILEKI